MFLRALLLLLPPSHLLLEGRPAPLLAPFMSALGGLLKLLSPFLPLAPADGCRRPLLPRPSSWPAPQESSQRAVQAAAPFPAVLRYG